MRKVIKIVNYNICLIFWTNSYMYKYAPKWLFLKLDS